jgi:hypothetical protein
VAIELGVAGGDFSKALLDVGQGQGGGGRVGVGGGRTPESLRECRACAAAGGGGASGGGRGAPGGGKGDACGDGEGLISKLYSVDAWSDLERGHHVLEYFKVRVMCWSISRCVSLNTRPET